MSIQDGEDTAKSRLELLSAVDRALIAGQEQSGSDHFLGKGDLLLLRATLQFWGVDGFQRYLSNMRAAIIELESINKVEAANSAMYAGQFLWTARVQKEDTELDLPSIDSKASRDAQQKFFKRAIYLFDLAGPEFAEAGRREIGRTYLTLNQCRGAAYYYSRARDYAVIVHDKENLLTDEIGTVEAVACSIDEGKTEEDGFMITCTDIHRIAKRLKQYAMNEEEKDDDDFKGQLEDARTFIGFKERTCSVVVDKKVRGLTE
jgi:hypothetical protein